MLRNGKYITCIFPVAKYARKLYPHPITVNSVYTVEYPYSTPGGLIQNRTTQDAHGKRPTAAEDPNPTLATPGEEWPEPHFLAALKIFEKKRNSHLRTL